MPSPGHKRRRANAAGEPAGGTRVAGDLLAAIELHRAGEFERAEAIYRRILENQPANSGALYLSGVLAHGIGDHPRAIDLLGRAIAIDAGVSAYHLKLADAYSESGALTEAIAAYRRAIEIEPDNAAAHNNLGHALLDREQYDEAAVAYGQAIELRPEAAEPYNNRGNALRNQGRPGEAVDSYRRAIELRTGYAMAHDNLGNALRDLGRLDEAVAMHRRAIGLAPAYAAAHNNLGISLKEQGEAAAAVGEFLRAIELKPDFAAAHNNLGTVLILQGKPSEAEAAARRAIGIEPDYAEAYNTFGDALMALGEIDRALAAFRRAVEVKPSHAGLHSNLIFLMCHDARIPFVDILAEARRWDETHAAPLAALARPHANDPDPERRLRVGYVSPDFRGHAMSYFVEPLIAHHDARVVEVFCYADVARPDAVTARCREHADCWRPTVGLGDEALAELIRADGIDILVDLAGHTAGSRLRAFAGRPAPVQVSHLAALGQTTGLAAMDYVLTDPGFTPDGYGDRFSETLWRLGRCFVSFLPSSDWPEISPLPARTRGHVVFAAFGNPSRISPPAIAMWSRVLDGVPGSRLLLKHGNLGDIGLRERLRMAFANEGVAERVDFESVPRGWRAAMDVYERVDIALDTFPLSGSTTTCIQLWMGLPVVTLASPGAHDRCSAGILGALGLDEAVVTDADDFVTRAAALAQDLDRLSGLRASLRERMRASPLLDHEGCARAVEGAYRDMWRKWCASTGGRRG